MLASLFSGNNEGYGGFVTQDLLNISIVKSGIVPIGGFLINQKILTEMEFSYLVKLKQCKKTKKQKTSNNNQRGCTCFSIHPCVV